MAACRALTLHRACVVLQLPSWLGCGFRSPRFFAAFWLLRGRLLLRRRAAVVFLAAARRAAVSAVALRNQPASRPQQAGQQRPLDTRSFFQHSFTLQPSACGARSLPHSNSQSPHYDSKAAPAPCARSPRLARTTSDTCRLRITPPSSRRPVALRLRKRPSHCPRYGGAYTLGIAVRASPYASPRPLRPRATLI